MNAGLAARILVLNALMGRIESAFPIEQSAWEKAGMSYENNLVVITFCRPQRNNASTPIDYHAWIGTIPDLAEKLINDSYLPYALVYPLVELGYEINHFSKQCTMIDAQVTWAIQGEINRIVFERAQKVLDKTYGCGAIAL